VGSLSRHEAEEAAFRTGPSLRCEACKLDAALPPSG
jgi:hypothetical protein